MPSFQHTKLVKSLNGYSLIGLDTDGDIISDTSNTNVYFASGDRLSIQDAIDDAPSGSRINILPGTHIVDRVSPGTTDYCLTLTKPVHLHLMYGATIKLADGDVTEVGTGSAYVLDISSSNVYIDGYGSIDYNLAGQTDQGVGAGIQNRTCIYSNGNYDNINIRDITIANAAGDGIYLTGTNNTTLPLTNVSIKDILMTGCREGVLLHWVNIARCCDNYLFMLNDGANAQDGYETSECDDTIFTGNYVEGARGSGFDLFAAGERCVCSDNIINECGSGIAIGNNVGGNTATDHIIKGNVIESPQDIFGIGVYLTTGADRVLIQGNIVRNVVTNAQHGIEARAGTHITILDNTIDTTATGIGIFTLTDDTVIQGNKVANTGGSGVGIRFDGDNCSVSNNKIITTGGAGINVKGNSNMISGNNLSGEIIDDDGTSNLVINNNVSSLDVGGATTPIHHDNLVAGVWTP